jgi:hypothetical protein
MVARPCRTGVLLRTLDGFKKLSNVTGSSDLLVRPTWTGSTKERRDLADRVDFAQRLIYSWDESDYCLTAVCTPGEGRSGRP